MVSVVARRAFLGLVVLSAGSVIYTNGRTQLLLHISILAAGVIVFMLRGGGFRRQASVRVMWLVAVLFTWLGISAATSPVPPDLTQYAYFFGKALAALLCLSLYDNRDELCDDLRLVLSVLMYHTLLAAALYPALRPFLTGYDAHTQTFGWLFYYPIDTISSRVNIMGLSWVRQQGLFWEPGVLQVHMNFLFMLAVFRKPRPSLAMGAALSVILTWSTAGLAILTGLLSVLLVRSVKKLRFVIPLIMVALGVVGYSAARSVRVKLVGENQTSFLLRLYDLQNAIDVISARPLSGIGPSYELYVSMVKADPVFTPVSDLITSERDGTTNSLLTAFVYFGIPIGLLMVIGTMRQTVIHVERAWLPGVVVILAMSVEPLAMTVLFLMFPLSAIVRGGSQRTPQRPGRSPA